jgi:uncharacterized protein
MKRWIALALAGCVTLAQAQTAASGPSPAKKELINKLLTLQQRGVDEMARTLLQGPVMSLGQRAASALQTIPPEKREATAKSIDVDMKQYLDEAGPVIKERTNKLAPQVLTPILDEKLTEDDLRQLIAWIESPVRKKYEAISVDIRNSLGERVLADLSPTLDPKLAALQDKVVAKLRAAGAKLPPKPGSSEAASAPKSGAKPAAKAASK